MVKLFESLDDKIKALAIKFSSIDPEDFVSIIDVDPTSNKVYLQWLLNLRVKNKLLDEDFSKTKELLKKFETPKVRQLIRDKDINSYKTVGELFRVIDEATSTGVEFRDKSGIKEDTLVAENVNWTVHIPTTYEESRVLGTGTHWCTAADSSDGKKHFKEYAEKSPLLIFINKHNPKEKFQLHKVYTSFLNKNDEEFDEYKIFGNDKNFFESNKIIWDNLFLMLKFNLKFNLTEKDLNIENLFCYSETRKIPNNLKIEKTCHIEEASYFEFPENLTVGTLILENTGINEIPKSLKCNKFEFYPAPHIWKLKFPDNFKINGNLEIYCESDLDIVCNSLEIMGDLNFDNYVCFDNANGLIVHGKTIKHENKTGNNINILW